MAARHGAKTGCPICGADRDEHYRPFCSKRCATVDLGRWLTGGYSLVGEEASEEPSDQASDQPSDG